MQYAVISDVHSNLEALMAVLERIDALGVDDVVCLGDLVGYNANPNECLEIIRKRGIRSVMGNHDSRVAGIEEPADFNPHAAEAVCWTRDELTGDNVAFLRELPRSLHIDGRFLMVHGWVNDTDRYIFGPRDAWTNFQLLAEYEGINLCFFGHTHVALSYVEYGGDLSYSIDERLAMEEGRNYLINPGGTGQPRDRDPRAPFLIYDTEDSSVTFHRVEYDVDRAMKKVLEAGLPRMLADRLKAGW